MERTRHGVWQVFVSVLVSFALAFSMTPAAFAIGNDGEEVKTYVSLGASNVNGYGLRGYIPIDDETMDDAALDYTIKMGKNVLGYTSETPDSYPVLIANELGYDLEQLAISSMRAEELRILLDNEYMGDSYSEWRFVGGDNWFDVATMLTGGNGGVDELREDYQTKIANAELITVDIGVNNFGVYISYQMTTNHSLDNDLALIDPEFADEFEAGKAFVLDLINEYGPEDLSSLGDLDEFVNTLAYALVGFCVNFDVVMEKIYQLNPDATVVAVSIQNLMDGLYMSMPGSDETLPLGDLFGALVNAANLYIAEGSPYSEMYYCADVREDGRVEFFLDDILEYNGEPTSLSQNIIDCFDVYDGNPGTQYTSGVHIKFMLHTYLNENWDAIALSAFGEEYAALVTSQFATFDEFMEAGEAGFEGLRGTDFEGYIDALNAAYASICPVYEAALNTGYDVLASILQGAAKKNTVDLSALESMGDIEDALVAGIVSELESAVVGAMDGTVTGPDYYTLSSDFFERVATEAGVSTSAVETVAALAVRTSIGNSFFGHPNPDGHVQLANAVMSAIENGTTGEDVLAKEMAGAVSWLIGYAKENYPEQVEAIEQISEYLGSEEFATIAAEVNSLYDQLDSATTDEQKAAILEQLSALWGEIQSIAAKVTGYEYVVDEGSYYVSLGDSSMTAYGLPGYRPGDYNGEEQMSTEAPVLLAQKLFGEDYEDQFKQLAKGGLRAEDMLYFLDLSLETDEFFDVYTMDNSKNDREQWNAIYVDAIEQADLITIGIGAGSATTFVGKQIERLQAGEAAYEIDWSSFVDSDEEMAELETSVKSFAAVLDGHLPEVMGVPSATLAYVVAESFIYGYASYFNSYPALLDKIHEINPEAHVVTVGYFNPIDDMTLSVSIEGETVEIPVGDYANVLLEASNAYSWSYALTNIKNTTFVAAPDAQCFLDEETDKTAASYIETIFNEPWKTHSTQSGHEYVANQIYNAIQDDYTWSDLAKDGFGALFASLSTFVAEYYDEALAYGYQYAQENGYVDVVVAALDELKADLADMKAWAEENSGQMPAELKAELIAEVDAAIASVDALKAFVAQTDATEPVVAADEVAVMSVDAIEPEVVAAGADDAAVLVCDIETHLANIDALIKASAEDLGEAALAELADMANAACAKLQAAKPAVEQCVAEKFEAAAEFILEKLGEAYEAIAQAACEAAKKYGPEAAEWIYNWILENPEAVIEFVVEYGPEAVEFVGQYEEEIFSVLGWLAENYGEDVVEFVVANPEYLEAMVDFVVEYGDEAWELVKAFADASGLTAAVEAEIANLEAELEALNAQISSELGAVDAAVKADVQEQIALIEVEIGKLEALVEQTGVAIAAGVEDVEALIAEIQATVSAINAAALELEAKAQGVNAELEAAVAQVVAAVEAVETAVNTLVAVGQDVQALFAQIVSAIEQFDAEAVIGGYVVEAVEAATTDEYEITKMSRYAAIGDGTIAGENSYADQFAAELAAIAEAEGGNFNPETQYDKLVIANEDGSAVTTADILAKIESGEWNEAIANADIITLSLGSEDLTVSAKDKLLEVVFAYIDCMMAGEEYQSVDASDWASYVGEEGAAQIDAAVEMINAELAKAIGDEAAAQMATDVIEGYVWSYVGFATTYADVIDSVQALSPEAEIVVVGLNNVLDGLVLNFGETEIDLGEYADYLFKSADLQLLAYALQDAEGNVTFVSAPEADSDIAEFIAEMVVKLSSIDFSKLGDDADALMEIAALIGNANLTSTWMPNAEGQAYIFGKIMEAMTITVNPEGAEPKDDTVTITLTEGEGYWISATDYEGTSFEVNKGDEVLVWVEADENWCINAVYANGQQIFPEVYDSCAFAFTANEDTVITVDAAMMEVSLKRIWGNYANQTSAKISLEAFDAGECDAVVIARDDDFRDAMSASGLAGALGCPIILTDRDGLSASAEEEIARLGVTSAYIIGGKGAMPGDFEAELAAMGLEKVERVFGNQSYDTSVECAKLIAQLNEEDGFSNDYAIVAYGQNFQDALSMSSFAYAYRVPIFLQTFGATSADRGLTDEAINLINTEFCGDGRYSDGILFVAGGEGAVSEESLDGIQLGERVRIGGDDGYETSLMIADYMVSEGYLGAWTVAVCCGALDANGLDALSGSALVGKQGGVILLASEQAAYGAAHMEAVEGFFMNNANDVWNAYILGGQYVMPTSVYNTVADYLNLAHEA